MPSAQTSGRRESLSLANKSSSLSVEDDIGIDGAECGMLSDSMWASCVANRPVCPHREDW
jgi:hypothetical protein